MVHSNKSVFISKKNLFCDINLHRKRQRTIKKNLLLAEKVRMGEKIKQTIQKNQTLTAKVLLREKNRVFGLLVAKQKMCLSNAFWDHQKLIQQQVPVMQKQINVIHLCQVNEFSGDFLAFQTTLFKFAFISKWSEWY